jgi:mRNA-degrading endonuclease RelE of RelBE toxin-antitoxin system
MDFRVELTRTVEKELDRFDKHRKSIFYKRLKKLENFPDMRGKPLRGRLSGLWQIEFLDKYRIWYSIDRENGIVTIEAVKHKKEAERRY